MTFRDLPDWAPLAFLFVVWPLVLAGVLFVVYVTFIG